MFFYIDLFVFGSNRIDGSGMAFSLDYTWRPAVKRGLARRGNASNSDGQSTENFALGTRVSGIFTNINPPRTSAININWVRGFSKCSPVLQLHHMRLERRLSIVFQFTADISPSVPSRNVFIYLILLIVSRKLKLYFFSDLSCIVFAEFTVLQPNNTCIEYSDKQTLIARTNFEIFASVSTQMTLWKIAKTQYE